MHKTGLYMSSMNVTSPVTLPERLSREWVEQSGLQHSVPQSTLVLDFGRTAAIDSSGIALVHLLNSRYARRGQKLILKNISDELQNTLKRWKVAPEAAVVSHRKINFFAGMGDRALVVYDEISKALSMLVETIYWGTIGLMYRRDFRRGVLGEQMYLLGFNAITIVVLLSFVIGVILSIQTAMQLRQFGADLYLVAMITWSMIRELSPLMTAIILAGRSGSATTAEIATMVVQEEVDAIKTMGLNHIQFIVVPKFWAISLTMPVLFVLSIAAGIFGCFVISLFYLDFTPAIFINEVRKNIVLVDFLISGAKTVVFSWLIIWVGAYYGFRVRGGAEEVGKETTASVVTAIFMIIIVDALFTFLYDNPLM